ncbi:MAG TPA: hypothetical protein VF327_11410 [Gaiellaceae bacterium]
MSAPVTVTVPVDSVAFAPPLTIVTATAAATEIGPPDVVADGVEVPPAPEPPLVEESVFAFERSPATCPSTPPGVELGEPFADAVALSLVVVVPVALNVAVPALRPAARLDAVTLCVAMVTATAAPTAAVAADDEPAAVVVALAVWVAVTTRAPVRLTDAVPSVACVVTVESATATAGATVTPPPEAPAVASVSIESVAVAATVSVLPFSTEPSPSVAAVESVTRFSATEAPTPDPVEPAVACADEALVDEATNCTAGTVADEASVAPVLRLTMSRAKDPARPTDPAAPETAVLEKPEPPFRTAST